nr:MAG TPA: hypothetical protein [Caudoviricetes sp.]
MIQVLIELRQTFNERVVCVLFCYKHFSFSIYIFKVSCIIVSLRR